MRWRYELAVSPNFFLVLLNNVCPVQEWSSLLQLRGSQVFLIPSLLPSCRPLTAPGVAGRAV